MPVQLYNTLSRSVEEFVPLDGRPVRVYGCGPTIYNHAHIGNFRTFITYDVLHRYLEWRGYDVRFVMNFTDVDDKTIVAALERGLTVRDYTAPFADSILADAERLGVRPFDAYPRATDYIRQMTEFVQRLVDAGLAYVTSDGSVWFDISEFPGYGKLSRMDPDAVRQGERVAADEYEKDDVRDFALWKAAKPEDVEAGAAWESPWGLGRPGWHLECSVMGLSELGDTLDIHLGGEDLIFPHHEDEIAQSEGATGSTFVRYWMHVKHLSVEGQKMSKSLGNTYTVGELLERGYEPVAIRHQLLSSQYRSELNFTFDGLEASGKAVQRLLDFAARLEETPVSDDAAPTDLGEISVRAEARFREAMDADLNTARALAAVFDFVSEANAALDRTSGAVPPADREATARALESMDEVLGLLELARRDRTVDDETIAWIEEKIGERKAARARRDFAAADSIRDELADRGVVLEDTAEGTRWKLVHQPTP